MIEAECITGAARFLFLHAHAIGTWAFVMEAGDDVKRLMASAPAMEKGAWSCHAWLRTLFRSLSNGTSNSASRHRLGRPHSWPCDPSPVAGGHTSLQALAEKTGEVRPVLVQAQRHERRSACRRHPRRPRQRTSSRTYPYRAGGENTSLRLLKEPPGVGPPLITWMCPSMMLDPRP